MAIKNITLKTFLGLSLALGINACGSGDSSSSSSSSDTVEGLDASVSSATLTSAVETYANIVSASYTESRDLALILQTRINEFLTNPTENNLETAKTAWKNAREPYGQTEVYRFYDGPIDDESDANNPGPEEQLNAWPLDELVIDYGIDPQTGNRVERGVIFDVDFEINAGNLSGRNGVDGEGTEDEAFVYTGYHAIEFLLWGQDRNGLDDNGNLVRDRSEAGIRPASDYETNADENHPNMRRRQYLEVVTSLLIADLNTLVDAWEANVDGNYRDEFLSVSTAEALRRISKGFGELSGGELAGERMNVALNVNNGNQEDEHSCFSDNTIRDIATNFGGIANVYRGQYRNQSGDLVVDGQGLSDVFGAVNSELNTSILDQITEIESEIATLSNSNVPFDILIDPNADNQNRDAVQSIINKLTNQITGGENLTSGLVENFSELINQAGVEIEFVLEGE